MPLGATDFAIRKTVCHLFYISSDPAPLNESCPLQASQLYPLLCAESQGPNLFDGFQEKPSWKLMSKGEKEITSKLTGERKSQGSQMLLREAQGGEKVSRIPDVIKGERETSRGREILKDPRCLMFKRRDVTCLCGGKTCSYTLICIKFYPFVSFSSDFLFPIFSQYPM